MLFRTPRITGSIASSLRELDELRRRLGRQASTGGPWLGRLRRQAQATAAESSVAIEGFRVSDRDAIALVNGSRLPDPDDEDAMAVACYARAMDHVGVMVADPGFAWSDRVVLDLHFDACSFQPDARPGLYRTGPISVTSSTGDAPAYVAPAADMVRPLMAEVVDWLERGDLEQHVVVRAAMAHLHIVSVHPFHDGNGRLSRIVQSLVLARAGLLAPELNSIEECLGTQTSAYYATLTEVQGGSYQPERDVAPWVELCVRAHQEQTRRRLRQIADATTRWSALEQLVDGCGWPDRIVIALEQSLFEGADRATYVYEAEVSPATASADLRRLLDAGLVVQRGRGRRTEYVASPELRDAISGAAA